MKNTWPIVVMSYNRKMADSVTPFRAAYTVKSNVAVLNDSLSIRAEMNITNANSAISRP